MKRQLAVALAFCFCASDVRADEVTLKNGTVYKDLTLVKETEKTLEFLTLDGKKLALSKDSILRHEKKPTARDEYAEKKKALPPKDAAAAFALGQWAKEAGLVKEAQLCFQDVIKLESDHEDARAALGQRKVNGRWMSAFEAERAEKAALEAEYKAKGWKKHGEEWLSPADFARVQDGLVRHGDRWVTKDIKTKIEKENWVWFEGDWVSPEDKEKMEGGFRKHEGKWLTIQELDALPKTMAKPIVHRSEHFEMRSNAPFKKCRATLGIAEEAWKLLVATLGTDPDLDEKGGPVVILYGAQMDDYKTMGKTIARGDDESFRSSSFGSFYARDFEKKRGAIATYGIEQPPFTHFFIAHAVAHAFIERTMRSGAVAAGILDALGAYAAGAHDGRYYPTDSYYWRYIQGNENPMPKGSDLLARCNYKSDASMAHAGFFLHYALTRKPDEMKAFMATWLEGKGGTTELLKSVFGDGKTVSTDEIDKDFQAFLTEYRAKWRPWDK